MIAKRAEVELEGKVKDQMKSVADRVSRDVTRMEEVSEVAILATDG